mgnify:FL=1|tara:strand:+ start:2518 stop:3930 length:1413 start_codon:yes stop_codon:yes gene_type:complete
MDLLKIPYPILNKILERETIENQILDFLDNFQENCKKKNFSKCLYIHGEHGIGKTNFVLNLLKNNNYDVLYYDNTYIRNKTLIEAISNDNIGNYSITNMFNDTPKKLVILIDDLYSMNYGDKNGIVSLIKLVRFKKTKKQLKEAYSNNPIICINTNYTDKKILELIKISTVFELNIPTNDQLINLLNYITPNIFCYNENINEIIKKNILLFLNNNLFSLRKIYFYYNNNFIYEKFYNHYNSNYDYIENNKNIKFLTKTLLNKVYSFKDINSILESDRTIISLILHENIIYVLENKLELYLKILDNFIFSDYIDRIIFQKQIWQLTEMNYIIKIFYNNYLLKENNLYKKIDNIIFTKILTKYSAEYNNFIFIYTLIQNLLIDKKDLIVLFNNINNNNYINELINRLEYYNISKLEIIRINKLFNNLLTNNGDNINEIIDIEYNDFIKNNSIELINDFNDLDDFNDYCKEDE